MNNQIKLNARLAVLQPGIHVIRFREGYDLPEGVVVGIHPAPLGKGEISIIANHSHKPGALTRIGDTAIVNVTEELAGILIVEYCQSGQPLDVPIDIAIDTIGGVAKRQQAAQSAMPNQPVVTANQSVVAPQKKNECIPLRAVTVTGTAIVSPNGEIGDIRQPNPAQAIAAFACAQSALPDGVTLSYGCRNLGSTEKYISAAGNMVGLPKGSSAICAINFTLGGEFAEQYELNGNVAFAGQPPLAIVSGKELTGPTGREALCALSVSIRKRADEPGFAPSKSVWDHPSVITNGPTKPKRNRKG